MPAKQSESAKDRRVTGAIDDKESRSIARRHRDPRIGEAENHPVNENAEELWRVLDRLR